LRSGILFVRCENLASMIDGIGGLAKRTESATASGAAGIKNGGFGAAHG
jgi:hypothetical protein